MKKCLLLLFCFISIHTFSQEIATNEIDKFTKKLHIETSFEPLVIKDHLWSLSVIDNLWGEFKYIDNETFFIIKWCTGDNSIIDTGDNVLFLDKNGISYKLYNTSVRVSESDAGTVGQDVKRGELGVELYLTGDFKSIFENGITDLRIYTNKGYVDFNIKKKESKRLKSLYELFNETLNEELEKQ